MREGERERERDRDRRKLKGIDEFCLHVQGAEAKYEIIFKTFFLVWLVQFIKKNAINLNFYGLLWFKKFFFLIKIQHNMSEQEKKVQRINDLLNAKTKPKFLCLLYIKRRKSGLEDWKKKKRRNKRRLFNCSHDGDLEGPNNVNKKAR